MSGGIRHVGSDRTPLMSSMAASRPHSRANSLAASVTARPKASRMGLPARRVFATAFWPPASWAGWWPRPLRPAGDVWHRLPRAVRGLRISMTIASLTSAFVFAPGAGEDVGFVELHLAFVIGGGGLPAGAAAEEDDHRVDVVADGVGEIHHVADACARDGFILIINYDEGDVLRAGSGGWRGSERLESEA